jgi:hypothetical protein
MATKTWARASSQTILDSESNLNWCKNIRG